MKKIILTFFILALTMIVYAQSIQSSKVYSNSILKTKNSNLKQANDSVITYRKQVKTKNIRPLKGYSNKYSYSYKNNNAVSKEEIIQQLMKAAPTKSASLTMQDTLQLISKNTDNLGFTHSKYQQYYEGIPVMGGTMIFHEKEGILRRINGNYYKNLNINTSPTYSFDKALKTAQKEAKEQNKTMTQELVITPLNGNYELQDFRLCYSFSFIELTIYIDAHSGEIVNKLSNTTHISSEGTANTLYSATQAIQTEYKGGKYYLHDNERNINTYNGINDSSWVNGNPFLESPLFSDDDNDWGSLLYLDYIVINQVNDNWYSFLVDESPDLYIQIFDSDYSLVYSSKVQTNTFPPVLFPYINIPLINPPYYMSIYDYDNTSSDDLCGIVEINMRNGETVFNSNQNFGTHGISGEGYHIATDLHWGLEKTYDFYLDVFGRKSFDGNGDTISAWINPNLFPNWNSIKAFAFHTYSDDTPIDFMCFGLGDGDNMNPLVSLDVVAHEFTHMVTNYSIKDYNNKWVGLKYQGESGAVNEGYSDIFASCTESYMEGTEANWLIGEDIMINSSCLRSMSNPKIKEQPDTYKGLYWKNTDDISAENDFGGVHQNNSIMNYWFYLLSEGGNGTNDNTNFYNVSGIGINKAAQIAYRNLTVYLTENSSYIDACNGSLMAAEDLYGVNSPEWWAVKNAWYAVGVINTNPNVYCEGQTK